MARGAEEREDAILEAALELFSDKGYGQVGVDELGNKAGLSGPAIYRHFTSKADILTAVFDHGFDLMLMATVLPVEEDARRELQARVGAYTQFILDHHVRVGLWVREWRSLGAESSARLVRRQRAYVATWADLLVRAYPELSEAEADIAANAAVGAMNSLATWPVAFDDPATIHRIFTSFVTSGVASVAASRPVEQGS